ncbi:NAD(P)/FAD-dependent oxidoreductase [Zafaria sp. J156]|uniref:FAD-dependent oxidoreductase n=1 Tax=Zafaria sp. J156 TaxID=3116490 RepID=UPI002E763372|nr:NAD(P)/FAD-dependent oxidoreductase [Zafaria sp. J156]MEE1622279.1 NAD(P)/FAD-dependent oxidoreductase [Zafaria sp. J156]
MNGGRAVNGGGVEEVDVVVAGAGPSGLALAVLLVQAGWRVRVFEPEAAPPADSRAIGLHPPGLAVLARAGVAEAAIAAGLRIRRGTGVLAGLPIRSGGIGCGGSTAPCGTTPREQRLEIASRPLAMMDFARIGGPYPWVLSLPQSTTIRLLEERLHALDHTALRRGHRVVEAAAHPPRPSSASGRIRVPWTRIRPESDDRPSGAGASSGRAAPNSGGLTNGRANGDGAGCGVEVTTTPTGGGPASTVRARFLVGADGIRSTVRGLAGIGHHRRRYPDRYLMGDFADSSGLGDEAVLFLHPEGIVESFPLPGEARRWVVRLSGGGTAADSPVASGGGNDATGRVDSGSGTATTGRVASGRGEASSGGPRADIPPAPDRRTLPEARAALLAGIVSARTGHAPEPLTAGMTSAFGTWRGTADTMVRGPFILIGDAAHEVSPIGGQGMTLGLLDAAELADLLGGLVAGLRPDAPSPARDRSAVTTDPERGLRPEPGDTATEPPQGDEAARFAHFSRRRLAAAARAGRQAHVNMVLGRPLPRPLSRVAARALGAALSVPVLKRAAARQFTMNW